MADPAPAPVQVAPQAPVSGTKYTIACLDAVSYDVPARVNGRLVFDSENSDYRVFDESLKFDTCWGCIPVEAENLPPTTRADTLLL